MYNVTKAPNNMQTELLLKPPRALPCRGNATSAGVTTVSKQSMTHRTPQVLLA